MNEVKIPFGRSSKGMVSVDAVVRGLDCECFCASCDARLVARKGEKNQHHFAHYVEPENCAEARETSLHRFAKQAIGEIAGCIEPTLTFPDDLDLGLMNDAEIEPWLDGIRPDVLADFDEPVAIEIRVAHSVPIEKIQKLTARKLATLEIDLSSYRNLDTGEDHWRQIILHAAHRFWLVPPAIVREEIERRAREEAARLADEERRARLAREMREAMDRQDRELVELRAREIERREREREAQRQAEAEYIAYSAELHRQDNKPFGALIAASGVHEATRKCSVCGAPSFEGWGVGLRQDWQTGNWYCLDHRSWITAARAAQS